jgi:hypothetical protein
MPADDVSGFTLMSTSAQRNQSCRRRTQNSRSRLRRAGPGPFPLEHRNLLAKREHFEGDVASTAEEGACGGEECEDE